MSSFVRAKGHLDAFFFTKVKVWCCTVGEEDSIEVLVCTFLLQTRCVGHHRLLVVLLFEIGIAFIFQAFCLFWKRTRFSHLFSCFHEYIQSLGGEKAVVRTPSGGRSSSWIMDWRQASSGYFCGSISSGAFFMNMGILLNSCVRQQYILVLPDTSKAMVMPIPIWTL